jgi:hypothetical protein
MRSAQLFGWQPPPRRYGQIQPIEAIESDAAWLRSWRLSCAVGCSIGFAITAGAAFIVYSTRLLEPLL